MISVGTQKILTGEEWDRLQGVHAAARGQIHELEETVRQGRRDLVAARALATRQQREIAQLRERQAELERIAADAGLLEIEVDVGGEETQT